MKMISLNEWKDVEIKDFCIINDKTNKVPTGVNIPTKELLNGNIPKISASGINNGVVGYYSSKHKNFRIYENFISVSFLGSVFYHEKQAFLDMKVHCIKPKEYTLNKYSALFLVTVIKKTIESCSYSDQISAEVLTNLKIKLPFKDGKIDWQFMEEFEKTKEKETEERIKCFKDIDFQKTKINTADWQRFKLSDLFCIKLAEGNIIANKTTEGTIPLVSSGKNNNGVCKMIGLNQNSKMFSANCITVDMFGKAFYQPVDFWAVSHGRVNILMPIFKNLNRKTGLFLVSVIDASFKGKYDFSEKMCNSSVLKKESILLPEKNGLPDWEFMEKYIDKIDKEKRFVKDEAN